MNSNEAIKMQDVLNLVNQARVKLCRDTSGAALLLDNAAVKLNELIRGRNAA